MIVGGRFFRVMEAPLMLARVCVLATLAFSASACLSFRHKAHGYSEFVSGPTTIAITGGDLYVDDEFGRVVRRISLKTGHDDRLPLPPGEIVTGLTADAEGRALVDGLDGAWYINHVGGLIPADKHGSPQNSDALQSRLPEDLDVTIGDQTVTPEGDVYFATSSDFAIGRRIWRQSRAGDVSTVVGPWAPVIGDPRQHGVPWYPKVLASPVLDGHGDLWFLDVPRHMILRMQLRTGDVRFVAGGSIEREPNNLDAPRGQDDYADLAADADGNVYAADRGGHRVVRFDHQTGRMTTVARVGGMRERGLLDGVVTTSEPDDIRCDEHAQDGTFVVEVVDSQGGGIPGADVYVLNQRAVEQVIVTDSHGLATISVPRSRNLRVVAFLAGFQMAGLEARASRGCTSRVRLPLNVGAMWTHRML